MNSEDKGAPASEAGRVKTWWHQYLTKLRGRASTGPSTVALGEILWSWVGAFLGIGALSLLNSNLLAPADNLLLIGSLGASAVLVYGAPRSPLAQPRNLVGGHLLSATVGVLCYLLLSPWPWLSAPLAVATAIALMHLTRTLHPPGGATALIAVAGSDQVHALGLKFVLMPVGVGVLVLLVVALLVNNLSPQRQYPEHWY